VKDDENSASIYNYSQSYLLDLFEPEDIIWARFKNGVTECGPVRSRQLDIIKKQLFSAGELLIAEVCFDAEVALILEGHGDVWPVAL